MPSSDYTSAVGGGLKLKGAKVDKKKKKKPSKATESAVNAAHSEGKQSEEKGMDLREALEDEDSKEHQDEGEKSAALESDERKASLSHKTEAQRKYEERRKKRLDERLKREGVQTHKERVEQLNKYLSGLSEHHDMPRIGPG